MSKSVDERFWSKVLIGNGCWDWTAGKTADGYGSFRLGASAERAPRVAWRLWHGEDPGHRLVLHGCDRPSCVRPSHLRLGTHADNVQDMVSRGRHGLKTHPEKAARGSRHASAKLTEDVVRQLREAHAAGGVSFAELASFVGVNEGTVARAVQKKNWGHQ